MKVSNWLLGCALVGLCGIAIAQAEADIVEARVSKFKATLPSDHPRLLLTKSELVGFRAFVQAQQADNEGAALWKKITLEPSNQALPTEPQPVPAGKRTAEATDIWRAGYNIANNAGSTALRFAFMYLATGEEKYGREAARWLVHLSSWDVNGGISVRNNDEAFIQSLRPMIFTYDWAYDALTQDERTVVEKAIKLRLDILWQGISTKFSLVKSTLPDNTLSHPMRFISTLGQGGLALWNELEGSEGKSSDQYVAWAYEYYLRQFPVWGGDDGGWSEGLDYWGTGLSQHIRFLDGMQLLGFDEWLARPFFRNNGYFGAYNLQPYPMSSFGDVSNITDVKPNRTLIIDKYALLQRDPYLYSFARKLFTRYPDGFNYYEFNAIDSFLHLYRKSQVVVAEGQLADLPRSRAFRDVGWVAMHSKLGDKNDDIMLGFKSSPGGSASHSFADQNSFVVNAFGEPLAISSGYREWYDSPHHIGWSRTTASKNAILVDGKGQLIKNGNASGEITRFYTGSMYDFTTGDAKAAYSHIADKALRHVLFVNRRYFVIVDELSAPSAASFTWLLHTREHMALDAGAGVITSSKGRANLRVQFLVPAPVELKFSQTGEFVVPVDVGFAKKMPKEWHAVVETISPRKRMEFVTVLYPYTSTQAQQLPTSRLLTTNQGYAFSITQDGATDVVLVGGESAKRTASSAAVLDGLAGFISLQNDVLQGFAMIEATNIKRGDFQLISSKPLTLEGRLDKTGLRLDLQPHPALELIVGCPFVPKDVIGINAQDWRYDAQYKLLTLKLPVLLQTLIIKQ